jgi:hypothetical protein
MKDAISTQNPSIHGLFQTKMPENERQYWTFANQRGFALSRNPLESSCLTFTYIGVTRHCREKFASRCTPSQPYREPLC